jgi:hypothetical protein
VPGSGGAGLTGFKTLPGFDQCGGDDVNWLSESRTTVNLAPGQSVQVQVTADAGVLSAPGDYAAALTMITDSPYPSRPVPVSLKASAPTSWAQISGTVSDAATGNPLTGATVVVPHAGRHLITTTTDSHGRYDVWLAPASVTIGVSDDGYAHTSRNVTVRQGRDTKASFALSAA